MDPERQLLALFGAAPSPQRRWRAFYRLWRCAGGRPQANGDHHPKLEAWPLFSELSAPEDGVWGFPLSWVQLLSPGGRDPLLTRRFYDKETRRRLLRADQRRRLRRGRVLP